MVRQLPPKTRPKTNNPSFTARTFSSINAQPSLLFPCPRPSTSPTVFVSLLAYGLISGPLCVLQGVTARAVQFTPSARFENSMQRVTLSPWVCGHLESSPGVGWY